MVDPEVFVFILGDPPASKKMFPVAVSASMPMSVGKWKGQVYAEKKNHLKGYDAADLTLWKLKVPIASTEVDKAAVWSLDQDLSGIAEEMLPAKKLSHYFPATPMEESLHVIAVLPILPSAGQKHGRSEDDGDSEHDSKRRGGPRHPGPESIGYFSLPFHSSLAQLRIERQPTVTVPQETEDQILAIHNAIKRIPKDCDLSNPATFIRLPFPSPHPASTIRFQTTKEKSVEYFHYMGRSKFTQVKEYTQSENFVESKEDLYLYGSSGSGKSHILAALVCQLILEDKRVVYIPDCRDLLQNFDKTIRIALCCAFYNDPTSLETIKSARDVNDLLGFWGTTSDKHLVVDQLNALEISPDNDSLKTEKEKAWAWLNNLRSYHRYIYSASANELSNRDVELKQAPIKVISLLGGMDEEEIKQWFKHHSNDLPTLCEDDRGRVEYLTGCIPLLLRSLFKFKDKPFDEHEFLGCKDLTKVNRDVTTFFLGKLNESEEKKNRYFEIMDDCLQGSPISTDLKEYDLRYFYVDKGRGRYTSGVVFETMILLFRNHRFHQFNVSGWYQFLSETKNPAVQGFVAEQLCLNNICAQGLPMVDSTLTKMEVVPFRAKPNWEKQLNDGVTLQLYTPIAYNFPHIDAIILWLDPISKAAHLYPIQITLSRVHTNSEDDFYAKMWDSWVNDIKDAGFTINSTFVWIDKQQPATQHREAVTLLTRKGGKVVQPDHQSTHVGIGQVDVKVAKALSLS